MGGCQNEEQRARLQVWAAGTLAARPQRAPASIFGVRTASRAVVGVEDRVSPEAWAGWGLSLGPQGTLAC